MYSIIMTEKISKELQMTMLHATAFTKAMEQGFILLTDDGHLQWVMGSRTLLAYFCGRLWAGDKGAFSRRKGTMVWLLGKQRFPGAQLQRLFSIPTLRLLRLNRRNMSLPVNYHIIDALFES